jgi:hypothetical protein
MNAYVVSRPSSSYTNNTTTCIRFSKNQIHTQEKYNKIYSFKKEEQIQESSPNFYNNTLQKHIKHVLSSTNHSLISKDVITIVGFGTSGSGKTFNLLGMDSSGLHNKYSVLCGVINDLKQTNFTNLTIEVTQVYKNKLYIIQSARKITVNQVFNTFKECLSCWKQEQFSTHNSSRAHLIIRLMLNGFEIRIIDTAGFETPDEERKHIETVAINQDMLAFKECMRAVADKQSFIPSRRRTITRVLFEHKNIEHINNHIFVIGAIDPNYDTEKMKLEMNLSNPKHPKISIVHNTLNYLTMLGCASVITARRPITSRQKRKDALKVIQKKIDAIDINNINNVSNNKSKVSNEIIKHINTIEPKFPEYVPSKPKEPNHIKPKFSLIRQRRLSEPTPINNKEVSKEVSKEISKIKDKYDEMKDDTELLNSRDMMQNIISNRRNSEPFTPVHRYIQNQEILMRRMNELNYDTDKLAVLNLINDQQLLTITMQMVVLERCDVKPDNNK